MTGTSADGDGRYSMDLPAGTYLVEATFVGYAAVRQTLTIRGGATTDMDFVLAETTIALDPVVTTAGRRAEKLSESTANIKVMDARELEVKQEYSPFAVVKNIPGIDYYEAGIGQQQPSTRGYLNAFTTNMLLLVDYRKVRIPSYGFLPFAQGSSVAKDDIERVEVILGPNSALYGANAGNGILNFITRDPSENPGLVSCAVPPD